MRTLVLGGVRSGKSAWAESLFAERPQVRYVATARASDAQMAERIRLHRERRNARWEVVEVTCDLAAAVATVPAESALFIDGLTLWLASLMESDGDIETEIDRALGQLARVPELVIVSEEVGGGLVPTEPLARRFQDLAGELNQKVAALSDRVVLVTAGIPMELKSARLAAGASAGTYD